ncbi:MAG: hypothetical protein AAGJ18_11245 [Bacteroidota bacterium]
MNIEENEKFNVQKERNLLLIKFELYTKEVYGLLASAIFFFSFFSFFVISWLYESSVFVMASFLFGAISLCVTCYLFYLFIFFCFSAVRIQVEEENVSITFNPVPWQDGNVVIPSHSIDKIFVYEKVTEQKGKKSYSYHLTARMMNGENRRLLDSVLVTKDEGLQIGQLISNFIGIESDVVILQKIDS